MLKSSEGWVLGRSLCGARVKGRLLVVGGLMAGWGWVGLVGGGGRVQQGPVQVGLLRLAVVFLWLML